MFWPGMSVKKRVKYEAEVAIKPGCPVKVIQARDKGACTI